MSEHGGDRWEVHRRAVAAHHARRAAGDAFGAAQAAVLRQGAAGAAIAVAAVAAVLVMAQGVGAASWAAGAAAVALTAAGVAWEKRFGRAWGELARRKASAEEALRDEDLALAEAEASGLDLARLPT